MGRAVGATARKNLLQLIGLSPDTVDEAQIGHSIKEAFQLGVQGPHVLALHEAAHAGQAMAYVERLEADRSETEYQRLRDDSAHRAKRRAQKFDVPEPDLRNVV